MAFRVRASPELTAGDAQAQLQQGLVRVGVPDDVVRAERLAEAERLRRAAEEAAGRVGSEAGGDPSLPSLVELLKLPGRAYGSPFVRAELLADDAVVFHRSQILAPLSRVFTADQQADDLRGILARACEYDEKLFHAPLRLSLREQPRLLASLEPSRSLSAHEQQPSSGMQMPSAELPSAGPQPDLSDASCLPSQHGPSASASRADALAEVAVARHLVKRYEASLPRTATLLPRIARGSAAAAAAAAAVGAPPPRGAPAPPAGSHGGHDGGDNAQDMHAIVAQEIAKSQARERLARARADAEAAKGASIAGGGAARKGADVLGSNVGVSAAVDRLAPGGLAREYRRELIARISAEVPDTLYRETRQRRLAPVVQLLEAPGLNDRAALDSMKRACLAKVSEGSAAAAARRAREAKARREGGAAQAAGRARAGKGAGSRPASPSAGSLAAAGKRTSTPPSLKPTSSHAAAARPGHAALGTLQNAVPSPKSDKPPQPTDAHAQLQGSANAYAWVAPGGGGMPYAAAGADGTAAGLAARGAAGGARNGTAARTAGAVSRVTTVAALRGTEEDDDE